VISESGMGTVSPAHAGWPEKLSIRLGKSAPRKLHAIGPTNLLAQRKTALFCSARAPGDVVLHAHDAARRLREEEATVISGFHSPIEKDCLGILLRGKQPIIICLARSMERIRLPSAWRIGVDAGRLLILSLFQKHPRRPTTDSARQRNELVAAMADEVLIIHATAGGQIEQLSEMIHRWHIPLREDRRER